MKSSGSINYLSTISRLYSESVKFNVHLKPEPGTYGYFINFYLAHHPKKLVRILLA